MKETAVKRVSTAIILIIIGVVLTVATASALTALKSTQTLPSAGMLTRTHSSGNVAVFTDDACTENALFVGGGTLNPLWG